MLSGGVVMVRPKIDGDNLRAEITHTTLRGNAECDF